MLTSLIPDPCSLQRIQATPAGSLLPGFAEMLVEAGYVRATIKAHLWAAAHLSRWQDSRGSAICHLNETSVALFKQHLSACDCDGIDGVCLRQAAGARRFVEYLRAMAMCTGRSGVLDNDTRPALLMGFRDWMRTHRGVAESTLDCYGRVVLDALGTLGEDTQRYEAAELRAFVLDRASRHGRSNAKLVTTALRAFVRYLVAEGQCRVGLDDAIPAIAGWRLTSLPRHIPASDVERLIASCDPTSVIGARDRAILLLLARLGLRAADVAALRLSDVDWEQATVQVAGKSQRAVRLPLTQETGDALLYYLVHARPASETDRVFLRVATPVGPFANSATISGIVKRAINKAGISAPAHGAHVLRHSAATTLLAEGAALDTIAVLLRHQSLDTTTIYAKVDSNALRQVAVPWPEVEPC